MWNSFICVMRSVMYSLFYASLPILRESISPFFLISFSKLGFWKSCASVFANRRSFYAIMRFRRKKAS